MASYPSNESSTRIKTILLYFVAKNQCEQQA